MLLAPRVAIAESKSQTVDVVAVIEPELSMTVEPETGKRIDLGTIHSSSTESRRSRPVGVSIHVDSNMGRPYQVTQELVQPMTNESGLSLPPRQLLVDPSGGTNGQPVDQAAVVMSSDAIGQSATRSVAYQLDVPPGQAAGTYRGSILMTVTAQ